MVFSPSAVERVLKVLGDESRLRIMQAVEEGERSVSEILERTGLPQTLASFHLRVLREAGILATERRGPFIFYRLVDASLPNLLEACARYGETLRETKSPDFQWPPWSTLSRLIRTRRR